MQNAPEKTRFSPRADEWTNTAIFYTYTRVPHTLCYTLAKFDENWSSSTRENFRMTYFVLGAFLVIICARVCIQTDRIFEEAHIIRPLKNVLMQVCTSKKT